MISFCRSRLTTTAVVALAIALSACGKGNDQQMTAASLPELPATLPLDASPSTVWPTAPEVTALPAAAPIGTVRVADPGDYYGYADAAYDYQEVLGDAPPDYSFDYDGVDPWAWEGYDQSVVFLEPVDDGYRYYYYRPGADEPYFIRDPDYGYGYDGGRLAVVYDSYGAVVPYDDYGPRRDYAARYLWRGRALYDASRRNDRRAISAANWAARSAGIAGAGSRWAAMRNNRAAWSQFHNRVASRQANYWREEATRRQSDTRRFAAWRSEAFRSPPPPRAIPATWTKANWANDRTWFLPARAERTRIDGNPEARNGNRAQALFQPQGRPAPEPGADRRVRFTGGNSAAPQLRPLGEARGPGGGQPNIQPGRIAPQPGPQIDRRPERSRALVQPRAARPDEPGRVARFQNAPQPQRVQPPRAQGLARPQPEARPNFRSGNSANFGMRREQPRPQGVVTPPQQPRDFGNRGRAERPNFQPRAPQPQMARPSFQSRAPQPQGQPSRPSFQPRAPQAATPPAPRPMGGGNGGGGGRGNGKRG